MKKNFLLLVLLSILLFSTHAQQAFSIHDKTDKPAIEGFFDILRKSNTVYTKHNKVTPEWIALSSEFKKKINDLKKDSKNIEFVPHEHIVNLPAINLDKNTENEFKNALATIDPISKKVYGYDASLVKKAFYALIHHHFIVVKQNGKYVIVFGTNCKSEAQKSAKNTKKTLKSFVNQLSFRLKIKLALLMAR